MILWSFLELAVLLFISAYFSSAEAAYISLTPGQIENLAATKGRRGRWVKQLNSHPAILLTTLLIMNNLANIGASALAAITTIKLFGSQMVGLTTGLLTLIVLIFCEVTPKQLALVRNETLCLRSAFLVIFLSWVFRPIIWIVSGISRSLTRLFAGKERPRITLESLLYHVKAAENSGVVESFEKEMIRNVFRINDTPVLAIMTHRTEVLMLDQNMSINQALDTMIKAGFSRAPVYKDHPEHVAGTVNLRNLIQARSQKPQTPIKEVLSKPHLVPGTTKVHELLFQFKREKINMAMVLDEYGGLDGVVTQEDIMEEIFGELYDEYEEKEADPVLSDGRGSWIIQGDADFWDLQDILGLELEHDERTYTLAGYLMTKQGAIPKTGQVIPSPEGTYTVLKTKKHRILTVRFSPAPQKD